MIGWTIALATAALLSAVVALAADSGPARPPHPPRCSQKEPQPSAPGWSAAEHELAPAGASEIRLCRYSSLNAHPALRLTHARLLDQASLVTQLVRRFDGLPREPRRVFACPADDGSKIVALLSYPSGHQLQISVGLKGCELVTNGSVGRTAAGFGSHPNRGPRLLAQLERLVG